MWPPSVERKASRGRDLAAWLGLVPRQFTTGGKPKLLGISKRGNKYLRKLLVRGARAALPHVAERDTPLGWWAKGLTSRARRNIAVVALANKVGSNCLGDSAARRDFCRVWRQSGWERGVNQNEKKQPGVGMIVAGGGLGKA